MQQRLFVMASPQQQHVIVNFTWKDLGGTEGGHWPTTFMIPSL